MTETLTGHALDLGWVPHKPETWSYRFATLREPIEMWHYRQFWKNDEPQFDKVMCPAGTRVKIVMVSRFGDVGITENLDAENGYGARVSLDTLKDFGVER